MTTEHRCVDCKAEVEVWDYRDISGLEGPLPKPPRTVRPTPHPGPRCSSHWRVELRRRRAANHEKRVQKTYGLARGEYAQLYAFQNGHCALCRRSTGSSRRLSVDHCHVSGEVRGELCRPCNSLLGHARDSTDFFRRCIAYLEDPPYRRMKEGRPFYE